jgi:hypothetical protein
VYLFSLLSLKIVSYFQQLMLFSLESIQYKSWIDDLIIFGQRWSKVALLFIICFFYYFNSWCLCILLEGLCCLIFSWVFPFSQNIGWNSQLLCYIVYKLTEAER